MSLLTFPRSRVASPDRWSIVLSGGDGTRLRGYVEKRLGDHRPKQYCAFTGTRSLLQHTVERAGRLATYHRTLTVIAEGHARFARPQLTARGRVIEQPGDRGTAAGLFLPLAHVRALAPDTIVNVLPADHFIDPDDRFREVMEAAGYAAAVERDRLVLVGATPSAVETDYAYVEARAPREHLGAAAVQRLTLSPSRADALAAVARGSLWHTGLMSASVDALWQAGRDTVPELMEGFDQIVTAIGTPFEADVIAQVYRELPVADLERDVLGAVVERCLVVRMPADVEWCDFSRADRIERTLARHARAHRLQGRGAA